MIEATRTTDFWNALVSDSDGGVTEGEAPDLYDALAIALAENHAEYASGLPKFDAEPPHERETG